MVCPVCKKSITDDEAIFCPYCASLLNVDLEFNSKGKLSHDNNIINDDSDIYSTPAVKRHQRKRNKIVYIILGVLLIVFSTFLVVKYIVQIPKFPQIIGLSEQQAMDALNNASKSFNTPNNYAKDENELPEAVYVLQPRRGKYEASDIYEKDVAEPLRQLIRDFVLGHPEDSFESLISSATEQEIQTGALSAFQRAYNNLQEKAFRYTGRYDVRIR